MNKCTISPIAKPFYTLRENPVSGHNSKNKASKIALEVFLILGAVLALAAVIAFAVTAVVLINSAFLIGSGIALLLLLGASGGATKVHTGHVFTRPIERRGASRFRPVPERRPVDNSWEPLSSRFGQGHDELFGRAERETRSRGNQARMGNTIPGSRWN